MGLGLVPAAFRDSALERRHRAVGLAVWHGLFELHNQCRIQARSGVTLDFEQSRRVFETFVLRATPGNRATRANLGP